MLKLSRKTLLALEAVIDIAFNARPEPVQAKEITARQGVPQRYLEQVMQQLVRAGILKGVRGPRGGYRLARERRRITLGEVVRVMRQIDMVPDPLSDGGGSVIGLQVVRPLWRELQDSMLLQLDKITVEDLWQRAQVAGVPSSAAERLDFTI
jgi:Rrf2 family protein